MGDKTRAQLVMAGIKLGGREDLATDANGWLNKWLDSQAAAWAWPDLLRNVLAVPLAAGAASFMLGVGSGGVTTRIHRINSPLLGYNSLKTRRFKCKVRSAALSTPLDRDPDVQDMTQARGQPEEFSIMRVPSVKGKWTLAPYPYADADYLFKVSYFEIPDQIDETSAGDSVVPWYPNDRTMEALVCAETYHWHTPERYLSQLEVVASMIAEDRVKFGDVDGTNDRLALDSDIFK